MSPHVPHLLARALRALYAISRAHWNPPFQNPRSATDLCPESNAQTFWCERTNFSGLIVVLLGPKFSLDQNFCERPSPSDKPAGYKF